MCPLNKTIIKNFKRNIYEIDISYINCSAIVSRQLLFVQKERPPTFQCILRKSLYKRTTSSTNHYTPELKTIKVFCGSRNNILLEKFL